MLDGTCKLPPVYSPVVESFDYCYSACYFCLRWCRLRLFLCGSSQGVFCRLRFSGPMLLCEFYLAPSLYYLISAYSNEFYMWANCFCLDSSDLPECGWWSQTSVFSSAIRLSSLPSIDFSNASSRWCICSSEKVPIYLGRLMMIGGSSLYVTSILSIKWSFGISSSTSSDSMGVWDFLSLYWPLITWTGYLSTFVIGTGDSSYPCVGSAVASWAYYQITSCSHTGVSNFSSGASMRWVFSSFTQ